MYNKGNFMKKMDQKKNKFNVAISKNSYCITLKNAGKRTQGNGGARMEGYNSKNPYYI